MACRSLVNASRCLVNSFSFSNNANRALSHSSLDVTIVGGAEDVFCFLGAGGFLVSDTFCLSFRAVVVASRVGFLGGFTEQVVCSLLRY